MPNHEINVLFTPRRLGRYLLPYRVLMAPMTRNRAGPGNTPTELMEEYYGQRASAALIVTEAAQVSRRGIGYPNTPGIHSEEQTRRWRAVVDAVHGRRGRIFLQLFHAGRISHPSLLDGETPVAPSAVRPSGRAMTFEGPQPFVTPRALDRTGIAAVIGEFAAAARCARSAGFDGVEIHAANGYLVDQFLRDGTNRRTDEYGGSPERRVRFLLEVTEAVAAVWDPDRVGVRLSPLSAFNDMHDADPEALFTLAAGRLSAYGLAYLHVVGQDDVASRPETFDLGLLRETYPGTLVVNGDYDRERAAGALASGAADFVAFGRSFLANPDLPARLAAGAPLNEPDPATFYGGDRRGYTDYPTLAHSEEPGEVRNGAYRCSV